jgi:Cu/Ag efflux protein CusF
MEKTLVTTALLALLGGMAPVAFAQADHAAHHGGASAPAEADAKLAEGTVKKIDKSAGKLTISHGPLESLGMPAMTMVFRAAEPTLLDQVKVGDKIRFAAEKVGGVLTVTSLEVAQ